MKSPRCTMSLLMGIGSIVIATTSWAQTAPKVNYLTDSDLTDATAMTRILDRGRGLKVASESSCNAATRGLKIDAVSNYLAFSFDSNSDKLSPKATATLDVLGKVLTSESLKESRFQIEGHTDSKGPEGANCQLSQRRARGVVQYLAKQFGIPEDRLVAKGYGEAAPVAPNKTEDGRRKNRRVQVINLGAAK